MNKVSNIESLLLKVKIEEENKTLDFLEFYGLNDRTKIGDEHEGIAKKIFDKALPGDLKCHDNCIVNYKKGDNSHRIDLVVSNDKKEFPNSSNYIVARQNALAAFEIKKTLTKDFLVEDIKKLARFKEKLIENLTDEDLLHESSVGYADSLFEKSVISGLDLNGGTFDINNRTKLQFDLYSQYSVQAYMPFTACFGFEGIKKKEIFIDAFIEGVNGFKPAAWPDIVTCGSMSIVKLDCRPYNSHYFFHDEDNVTDLCITYGFFDSNSFTPYVEHIWEKLNTNLYLGQINEILSDTTEEFYPLFANITLKKENELKFIRMDSNVKMKYSDSSNDVLKMILKVI